jgi:hypothetical protein
MTVRSFIKRAGVVTGAATALVVMGATSASAHHCYIPMYSLNSPASANWIVFTAEDGAALFGGFETGCDAASDAGYAALEDADLPAGIKLFEKMTIGAPTEGAQGAGRNPNGANGIGLEYFGSGSTLAEDMVATYIEGASSVTC